MPKSMHIVIPSGAPKARRRGIAVVPTGRPLYRDDCDSSPSALRAYARNDTGAPLLRALLLLAFATSAQAQSATLPFGVGERLEYRVSVGRLGTVGEGVMSVDGPVDIRGTATLALRSDVRAQVGLIKSTERAESWIDPTRMAALRYRKRTRGMFSRGDERVELFPDEQRWENQRGRNGQSPTSAPLDELSFIYYLRTLPLTAESAAASDRVERHYDRDRNPIGVRVIGRDTVHTRAGTFATIVVEMRVRDPQRYGGEGTIRLYLSDDVHRYPVRIESSVPVLGATVLTLEAYTAPEKRLAHEPR